MSPEKKTERNILEEKSLKDIVLYYLSYWKYIVASLIICAACSFIYLRYQNPVYRTNAKVIIKDERRSSSTVDINMFNDLGSFVSSTNVENEIEVLKSLSLKGKIVDSLNLQIGYFREGRVKRTELYKASPIEVIIDKYPQTPAYFSVSLMEDGRFILSDDENNIAAYAGEKVSTPWGDFSINFTGNEQEYPVWISINKRAQVSFEVTNLGRYSAVLDISTESESPQKSRDILNTLIHFYNQQAIEDKQTVTQQTLIFIDERIADFSRQLGDAEKGVEAYKQRYELTNIESDADLYRSTEANYSERINELSAQKTLYKSTEDYLLKEDNRYEVIPTTLIGIADQGLMSIIGKYNELILNRKRSSESVKEESPIMKDLNSQITQLRNSILQSLRIAANNIDSTLDNLYAQERSFSNRIRSLSTNEREIHEMAREKNMIESIFLYLLQKREETAIMMSMVVSNARVVDSAWTSPIPVSPKTNIIYLAALLLGLFIPIAIITLIDVFDNKIRSKEELSVLITAPLIGQVPDVKNIDKIFLSTDDNSAFAEMYRQLSTNLSFMLANEKNKVIMVTSSVPAEGKSTFSVNLATTYLTLGKKVLLIDLDMRNSKMKSAIPSPNANIGISSYLADKSISEEAIIQEATDKIPVDMIYSGIYPPNPVELLMNSRLEELIKWAEKKYDFIIIDTPPVGYVTDAFIISKYVDTSIFVIRTNVTHKQYVYQAEQIYKENRLHNMCYAVKGLVKRSRYGYGYGGYGYGYGYGYGGKYGDKYGNYYGKKRS